MTAKLPKKMALTFLATDEHGFARFQRGMIGGHRPPLQRSRICCFSRVPTGLYHIASQDCAPAFAGLQRGKQRRGYKEEQILLFVEER
jgi:hypothetical protein